MRRPRQSRLVREFQTAQPYSVPAPVGGWNTRDPLASMPETDAVILTNLYPNATSVDTRNGAEEIFTGFDAPVKTLISYSAPGTQEFFAVTTTAIYDVTTPPTPVATGATVTNSYCQYVNFTNSAGSFILLVNGVDDLWLYDGATWTAIDAVSVPAITGVVTADLININIFKNRIWFVEKDSLSAWYLPAASIAGAATEFPLGGVFKRGGHLVSMANWTFDGGQGLDDYAVFVSSEGEIAVYQGTDPNSPTTFSLVGVYYVGSPLGLRCFTKYGGDLLFLSRLGIFPLSKALQSASVDRTVSLSAKIDPTFLAYADQYGDNEGWAITVYPKGGFVLVNVPLTGTLESSYSEQFVMNSLTGAWCRFLNWNSKVFEVHNDQLYFGLDDAIAEGWTGPSDFGNDIKCFGQSAFTFLGNISQIKHFKLLRPILLLENNLKTSIGVGVDVDFDNTSLIPTYLIGQEGVALWDTAEWDLALWAPGLGISKDWVSAEVDEGYCISFKLKIASKATKVSWISTTYTYQAGGLL